MLAVKNCCHAVAKAISRQNPLKSNQGLASAQIRSAGSFFVKRQAGELWKAVTSVSNQGKMRGRSKGLYRIKNLNKGQRLGMGPARISFPGLTSPVQTKDRERFKIDTLNEEKYEDYTKGLQEIKEKMRSKRGKIGAQYPLERGWAGASPQGRHFGVPISASPGLSFEGFDSILVEQKMILSMDGLFGRTRSNRIVMVTGNKNGTAGFTTIRAQTNRGFKVYQKAVNKAGLRLMTIPLYENRTVYHDFFSNFGKTRILVKQKPPGHGIKAQRVVKAICEMIGIKDLEAQIEGANKNYVNVTKAFFLGLLRQRSHQELANEKRLHLVEFRAENDNFPLVVGTPNNGPVRTKEEIGSNEILDFEMISFDGNLPMFKEEKEPFYHAQPRYARVQRMKLPYRHHEKQKLDMLIEQGRVASHLTDKYPECKKHKGTPRQPPEDWVQEEYMD